MFREQKTILSRRLNIKMVSIHKLIHRLNTIPIKTPAGFFAKVLKVIKKFMWKCNRSRIAETVLKKKKKVGEETLHF